jgi:hypothetical protein
MRSAVGELPDDVLGASISVILLMSTKATQLLYKEPDFSLGCINLAASAIIAIALIGE